MNQLEFRSIWISDTHLGGKDLKSKQLYDFLRNTKSEYLYLVGDIVDMWKLKRKWYWPPINDAIAQLIFQKASSGTKVIYIPGNHDAEFRKYCGATFKNIEIHHEYIHENANGNRFLILHGDKFDSVVQNNRWLADIGSIAYELLLKVNRWFNNYREIRGKSYFSLSAYLKHKCKLAVNYISNFEQVLIDEMRKQNVDGLICGHIHNADIKNMDGFLYTNSGDWVESCTALAENFNGTMGIIKWPEQAPISEGAAYGCKQNPYRDRCLAPTN